MKKHIRILSAQDVSCFGQCSLTVALPVLSALGVETAILPTAILSTHTGGFSGFTFRDLQDDIEPIKKHWEKEKISFDAVYTGYLGSSKDVDLVLAIALGELNKGPVFVDPAFADHGRLYGGFDEAYVEAMKKLCAKADVLLPNLTEAAFLLGVPYNANPNEEEIQSLFKGLRELGAKTVILKGIGNNEKETGFIVDQSGVQSRYSHKKIERDYHGTGDLFASIFVGSFLQGKAPYEAAKLAADFVAMAIENTLDDPAHGYGVKFEPILAEYAAKIVSK